jgi:hypothetical protein
MSEGEPSKPLLAVLVRDLMFSSKITAEANAQGKPYKMVRDPAKLAELPEDVRLLIVDLNLEGAIEAAGAWRAARGKPVVGFVSHVDGEAIAKAKAAGIDQVMARSRFVGELAGIVRG